MERLISLVGLLVFVGIAYGSSVNRNAIRWQPVLWGIALQISLAVLILRTPLGLRIFQMLGEGVTQFLAFSDVGASFLFGETLVAEVPIAFKILPTIVFFSAVISIFYHYNILPQLVKGMAWLMVRTMKTSGPESLTAASNVFVGPIEASLVIKPYVAGLTLSELHAVMTGGFATVAGGVMAAYIAFGIPVEHLLAASVMSAPAGLAISKLMYPETEASETFETVNLEVEGKSVNVLDAITNGTLEGLQLALNIGAMLLVFLALLAALNGLMGWLGSLLGLTDLTLEGILGGVLAPVAWLMGVPWSDCGQVGALLGKKTILTEFLAYVDLKRLIELTETDPTDEAALADRSIAIATYALCGFSNLGQIGIQIGGLGGIAPDRRPDLARLSLRALLGGTLACFMTATIAGMLL